MATLLTLVLTRARAESCASVPSGMMPRSLGAEPAADDLSGTLSLDISENPQAAELTVSPPRHPHWVKAIT